MEKTMNRICVFILVLALLPALALAETMISGPQPKPLPSPMGRQMEKQRNVPLYTFTKTPSAIITNYYDYMIGAYNGMPLRVIPDIAGGGYFMTYHGRRQPTSTRRVFYTYLDQYGNVVDNTEITSVQNHEGYPTLAVDPVSGKPLYAWHANTDDDGELEVEFTSDAFLGGISGLFNPTQNAIDNPITMTAPDGTVTEVNDFDWPTAQIGPSPVAGKRRIYLAARNSETQTYGPSENLMLAYADFNDYDIENGIPFVWNHTSIPEMNQWNVDEQWRRPFHAITTDNAGNVYYAGYHFATESDGSTNIREADMDVFRCPNYGEGTWTRISDYSWIPTWNPIGVKDSTGHYFVGDDYAEGYPDSLVVWALANSSHINAVMDNIGRLHVFGNWAMSTKDGGYWQDYQVVKEFVYDPANETFQVKEVFPQKDPADTFNQCFVPWDMEAP